MPLGRMRRQRPNRPPREQENKTARLMAHGPCDRGEGGDPGNIRAMEDVRVIKAPKRGERRPPEGARADAQASRKFTADTDRLR